MKQVLVTGLSSYVGKSLIENNVKQNNFLIDTISLKNNEWLKTDFSNYDSIVHLAAIVHRKGIEIDQYFQVNRDLTIKLAEKAKREGVKQFVFFSSMSVFDDKEIFITNNTAKKPQTAYGSSKSEAEEYLLEMNSPSFKIVIIRPPMIYGFKCPGNYSKLSKISPYLLFFPRISNERSMIYIENLIHFTNWIIKSEVNGVFHPQNKKYVNTFDLVKQIRNAHNKRTIAIPFPKIPKIMMEKVNFLSKILGDLKYCRNIDSNIFEYNSVDFKESIELSEKGIKNEVT